MHCTGKGEQDYAHHNREKTGMATYDPDVAFLLGDLSLRVYFDVRRCLPTTCIPLACSGP